MCVCREREKQAVTETEEGKRRENEEVNVKC